MRQRLLDQHRNRYVVKHIAVLIDDAVLAVRRVGVKRDVGHDGKLGQLFLDGAHCALHQPFRVRTLGAVQRLVLCVDDRKKGDSGYAKRARFGKLGQQDVYALARYARH